MNIHFEYKAEEITEERMDMLAMAVYRAMRGDSS